MQKRHTNRERYFEEQAQTTRNYYIPYIKEYTGNLPKQSIGSRVWRRRESASLCRARL